MGDLFLLSERQMARIEAYFPLSHGVLRVDDRHVVSGVFYVIRNGLQWKDVPAGYDSHKTLYNRFIRWSRLGGFDRIFAGLAGEGARPGRVMIDATHLKAHRTAASLLKKGAVPRRTGRTNGGLNSKLHTVCDDTGSPIVIRLRAERPNHVWPYDFVENRTHDGRKYRMLNVIDEFTHECLAIRIALIAG